jgi:hypothetical protein
MSAARDEGGHDMVAHREVRHAGADLFDHPRALMAEHHRQRPRPVAVDDGQIGMAKTGGAHAQQHLAGSGRCKVDLDDLQRS